MKHSIIKRKIIGKYKRKEPQNVLIDDFVCLRSKMYSFKCGDDIRNKLNCIPKSQSKHIKFERIQKMFRWRGISKRL